MSDLNTSICCANPIHLNTREDNAKLLNLVKDIIFSVTKKTKTLSQFLNLPDKYNLVVLTGNAYVTINE